MAASPVAQQVIATLQQGGLSHAGAAGVAGNWSQESSLNPSSPGGYLGQWQGDRATNLANFARSIGQPITSPVAQSQFALHELKTSYPGLYHMLQTTNDPGAAAVAVSNQYERPNASLANIPNRVAQARALAGSINKVLGGSPQLGGLGGSQTAATGSRTITSGGGVNTNAAGIAALLSSAESPINTSGKVSSGNLLSTFASNLSSGKYMNPTTKTAIPGSSSSTTLPHSFQGGRYQTSPGASGEVNPLPGSTFTRTDQGVDGTGHTFLAPAQSRVLIADTSNAGWKGGGYIAAVITSGPDKGKVWYAAEGVAPTVHPGQVIGAGTRIATPVVNPYNGIVGNYEWGWADPNSPARPLAQAQGSVSEGQQTGAGQAFRDWLNHLGAAAGPSHA